MSLIHKRGRGGLFNRGTNKGYNVISYWTTRSVGSLTVISIDEKTLRLDWVNTGTGFSVSIERKIFGGTFTQVGTVADGVNTYSDNSLTHNTIYVYRIRPFKGSSYGTYSDLILNITKEKGWLSGSINPANAIAAYEPIYAASLAESYINKANPGTFNANPLAAPTLVDDGWDFDNTDVIDTGIVPANTGTWSILILVKGYVSGSPIFCGKYDGVANTYFMIYRTASNSFGYHGGSRSSTSKPDEGAYMINGNNYLVDHAAIGTMTAPAGTWAKSIYLGALNNNGSPSGHYDGIIKLAYIWDVALSAAQLLRLKWNMEAINLPYKQRAIDYRQFKLSAMICWNMSTFVAGEIAGADLNPDTFAPTGYDMGQWLDALVSAKVKRAFLVPKHEDGFCLWPTEFAVGGYLPYSIERTTWYANNGNPDIVLDFVNGCRARGILPAFYMTIVDLTWESRTGKDETTDAAGYIAMIEAQLTELLTNYGQIDAIWFDAWLWEIGYEEIPFATIYNFVKSIQPNCVVIDNRGGAGYYPGTDLQTFESNVAGHIPANNDKPSEEIETIRVDNKWFFHQGQAELAADYHPAADLKTWHDDAYNNFGCYHIAVQPNKAGVLPAALVTRLGELGALI